MFVFSCKKQKYISDVELDKNKNWINCGCIEYFGWAQQSKSHKRRNSYKFITYAWILRGAWVPLNFLNFRHWLVPEKCLKIPNLLRNLIITVSTNHVKLRTCFPCIFSLQLTARWGHFTLEVICGNWNPSFWEVQL